VTHRTIGFSWGQNLDDRLQSLLKAAFYSVKPPAGGPRKKAKEYPPLEAYLRHLLLVRLEATESVVSMVTKQLVRLPWHDPSHQCVVLVGKLLLKACRQGRYKTIAAVAAVAAKLRTQRAAGEVSIRLTDAVLEELRWALEHPNVRDQQRIITYTRLLGELHCTGQVSGNMIMDQLYEFINVGHLIPDSLREASKALAATAAQEKSPVSSSSKLPVYNSSGGVTQVIPEDEEMEEDELPTQVEDESVKPVAVSPYSLHDPRVPSAQDPLTSSYRITLVCTLLESAAPSLIHRGNLPRLRGFFAAFQRYLFTKTVLPTDVEFALLDTFDIVESLWKSLGRGGPGRRQESSDSGFPRYTSWWDAHTATVAVEESEALFHSQKRARLEALADESQSLTEIASSGVADEQLFPDEESESTEDEDEESVSVKSKESGTVDLPIEDEAPDMEVVTNSKDDDVESEEEEGIEEGEESEDDDSAGETDEDDYEDDDDEEEFDEEAYMLQLEEEAFERELRMLTMEAIEKGKNTSRKQVGDSMISGSLVVKRKTTSDGMKSTSEAPTPGVALGGEVGISFQVLKKGNKGKMEVKELVVPVDTHLALAATRHDDAAARERDEIKQRVLRYEAQSESATGGNVYLEQERLQRNRNRPLSMDEIDKNFGTTGGELHPSQTEKKSAPAGRGTGRGGGLPPGGRLGGRGGRSNAGGRHLF
jgi:regulator of nonsense transcripts 2